MINVRKLRAGVREAADSLDQAGGQPNRLPGFTYVPPSHARALDPQSTLVEGIRGAGKSFWWAQLASSTHRAFIQSAYPEARFGTGIKVVRGFGTGLSTKDAPGADVLAQLVEQNYRPRAIWRAVLAHHAGFSGEFAQLGRWSDRADWVQNHAEDFDELLDQADRALDQRGETLLILFDALDRLAENWEHINPLAKALLQVALDARSTKRIRFKVFLRPDMLQDHAIIGFPDFSKLSAHKASLAWRRSDLYALFFQCLANTQGGGSDFRALARDTCGAALLKKAEYWVLPSALRSDEADQELTFKELAGSAMGSSPKRGKPYTWLVNHLQDGLNQVSPRSFFSALKTASEETRDDYELALDYRAIQLGVQKASQIRVQEITSEDYPWVELVMSPLYGKLTVPCEVEAFKQIWKEQKTLVTLEEQLQKKQGIVKLPPQNLEDDARGVLRDLEALGLIQTMPDQRIQMPDVYRIAFGFGRKGGVKPLK
ncbi:hypothetical protein RP726_01625 [Candidatus Methylospira mobilis]|uniref:hypothetical protein n=1 Tax=Candidatus Methylospira mobilis TaxID=1808979 RepID=UPI0028ED393C|nr:hypothetical protein [Candidatus Methylospira mobilis]WNV05122.1 hypothetical protein RP726_01625 [Candidatus Methylospira mobilis]